MKKVLLICYYFPPLGLAGVGRPLNLFKKFPAFQYDCHVLTVKPVTYRHYEPELLDGLDKSKIYRSGSHDPQRLMYLLGVRKVNSRILGESHRITEKFFPDSKAGWVKPAIRLSRTLMDNNRYEVVISTSPPISSHLIARQLAQEYQIPWVADFRDFWTSYKVEDSFADEKNKKKGLKLLEEIKRDASAITAVNPTVASYLQTSEVIFNGYDNDLARLWRIPTNRDFFYIGLLGHQNRSKAVTPLLKVLVQLREKVPEVFKKVKIIQVGMVDSTWFDNLLSEYDLKNHAISHGLQKRKDTINLLSEAALFYIGLESSGEQKIMPGRMFDLLASGRPVLAYVAPDSEIARLLDETGAGIYYGDDTIDTAVNFLQEQIKRFFTDDLPLTPLPEYANPYSSVKMVEKFACLLDRLI